MCLAIATCVTLPRILPNNASIVCCIPKSCPCAYPAHCRGGTVRNKWLHRGPAHWRSTCHEHCKSGMNGMASHNFCSSGNRSARKFATNSSCPTGVPRILMPRGFQTSGPRSARSAGRSPCEIPCARLTGMHPDASAFPESSASKITDDAGSLW